MKEEDFENICVEVGLHNRVHIAKLFGPLAMLDIRISIDYYSVSWVVEREGIDGVWSEVARIDGNFELGHPL